MIGKLKNQSIDVAEKRDVQREKNEEELDIEKIFVVENDALAGF